MAEQAEIDELRRLLERERRIRRQAEAIAEDVTRRLYESDRLKSLFVSTVSHELRTPLMPIVGFSESLTQRWDALDEAGRRDLVDRIHYNATTLQLLVDSLLDFSQLETSDVPIAAEDLHLSEEVRHLVDQLEAMTRRHILELDLDATCTVRADRAAVARIAGNLVGNAVKYSPEGGRIRVVTETSETAGILAVEDDGPGITPAERERIFRRYYRGDSELIPKARGLGIGLALVRALAEAMGGDVGVDEASNGGARFWVTFPLAQGE